MASDDSAIDQILRNKAGDRVLCELSFVLNELLFISIEDLVRLVLLRDIGYCKVIQVHNAFTSDFSTTRASLMLNTDIIRDFVLYII